MRGPITLEIILKAACSFEFLRLRADDFCAAACNWR